MADSGFRLLMEDILERLASAQAEIRRLQEEDTLTQVAVKDTEPEHPYPGYAWVDTS